MRKIPLFSAVLSLFLLVPASITWAQKTALLTGVVYQNNMVKIPFSSFRGNVTVYLPDDLAAGDQVNGKVVIEPNGKNQKQTDANLAYLQNISIIPSGSKTGPIPIQPFRIVIDEATKKAISDLVFTVPVNVPADIDLVQLLQFRLGDEMGKPVMIGEVKIQIKAVASEGSVSNKVSTNNPYLGAVTKKIITGDEPLVIELPQTLVARKEIPEIILQEVKNADIPALTTVSPSDLHLGAWVSSPRQMILNLPPNLSGARDVLIKTDDSRVFWADRIYIVSLRTDIGKNNLRKDETTQLSVSVTGFENCPWPAQLKIENTTSNTVALEKGNQQVYQLRRTGTEARPFSILQQVVGIRPGNFTIKATLHVPPVAYSNLFEPQLNILNTPDDFNTWAGALMKELKEYAAMQAGNTDEQIIKANAERAYHSMPVCTGADMLAECKTMASVLLRPLPVSKATVRGWSNTFEAGKIAAKRLDAGTAYINWDIIRDGLVYAQHKGELRNDAILKYGASDIMYLIDDLEKKGANNTMTGIIKNRLDGLNSMLSKKDNQDEWVHLDTGKYKSEYVPSDYKHMDSGPAKSEYWPKWLKHAALAGPRESWYIPESYIHIDSGWDKSNYISPLLKHATEEGPDKSHYVANDWYHLKTGPSRSTYLPKSIRHIDTGANKSRIEYDVPGVDKPIREWEYQQKDKPVTKAKYSLHNNRGAEKSSLYNPWQKIKPIMIGWNKEEGITKSWLEKNPKPIYDSIHQVSLSPYPSGYFSSYYMRDRFDRTLGDSLPGDPGDDWRPPPKPYKHIEKGREKSQDVPEEYVHADEEGRDESFYIPPDYKHASEGPYKSNYHPGDWVHISVTGTSRLPTSYIEPGYYHASVEGPDKSEYVSPRHVHATEGVFKTSYIDSAYHHASEEGPDKSKYYFESYHASEEGPYKSRYIRDNYKHVTEEGPDKSNYVNKSTTRHAFQEGPDKSKYLSYDWRHEEYGADKSKYSQRWHYVDGPDRSTYGKDNLQHATEEGPEKSKYVDKNWNKHASEEGPDKSRYINFSLKHAAEEGPEKSKYVDKLENKHVSEQGPDKSKYKSAQK